jgi:hypothetical protein
MTLQELTVSKIENLPESLISEVNDFIDFLQLKKDKQSIFSTNPLRNEIYLEESDFSDYLANLQKYEDRLSRGEINW